MHHATAEQHAKNSYVIVNAAMQLKGSTSAQEPTTQDQVDGSCDDHDIFDKLGDFA